MFKDVLLIARGILQRIFMPAVILAIAYVMVKALARQDTAKAMLPMIAIVGTASIYWLITRPKSIIHVVLIISHFIAHISRLGINAPVGLSVDGLLALGLAILIVTQEKDTFKQLKSPEMIAIFIWIGYTWMEIANPRSPGPVAWFYAMRSISLYYLLTPIVTLGLFKKPEDVQKVITFLIPLSIFVLYVAIRQDINGMNSYEMRWLLSGPIKTHFIRGKMRVFGILSDASTYGAYAGYVTTVFLILAAYTKRLPFRFAYLFLAMAHFYGLMLSGSRGPLGIIGFGGMAYLILSKRVQMAVTGAVVGGGAFVFLKYTTILQGNYNVARLRSALDPNDASFQVRKAKEAILSVYMRDKPIGGGIGSAGMWGERFAPGSFLAETPTDGLYSRIWMETGIIGLYLYVGLFLFLIIMMGYRLWNMPDTLLRQRLLALYCGFVGLVGASYVNELITQVPLSIYSYMTPALILLADKWVKEGMDISDPVLEDQAPRD